MPRVYVPKIPSNKSTVKLFGENARYLTTVLRLRNGDGFELFDASGANFDAVLVKVERSSVEAEIKGPSKRPIASKFNIVLLQGMLKGSKMDLVVQKTTELGVHEIIPLITARSQVRETRKLARWQKIANEASRQCGRVTVPVIREPMRFDEFFRSRRKLSGYIFGEEKGRPLSDIPVSGSGKKIITAVGPEGGFTDDEVTLAEKKGLVVTTLGSLILRAETAAISTVALLQFLHGGLSKS
jgi:16S rRNA (uracil1498-N3)-methyltransferase